MHQLTIKILLSTHSIRQLHDYTAPRSNKVQFFDHMPASRTLAGLEGKYSETPP